MFEGGKGGRGEDGKGRERVRWRGMLANVEGEERKGKREMLVYVEGRNGRKMEMLSLKKRKEKMKKEDAFVYES